MGSIPMQPPCSGLRIVTMLTLFAVFGLLLLSEDRTKWLACPT